MMNSDFVLARHRLNVQIASYSSETEQNLGWRARAALNSMTCTAYSIRSLKRPHFAARTLV